MEEHLRRLMHEISVAMGRAKDEDREELTRLHGVVQGHLEGSDDGDDRANLVGSLEQAETRFEVDHPRLASAIQQALETLSSSGI